MRFILLLFFIPGLLPLKSQQRLDSLRQKVNQYVYANQFAKAQKAVLTFLEQKNLTPQENFHGRFLYCDVLEATGNLDEAIDCLNTCRTYASRIKDNTPAYQSLVEGNIAECYFALQDYAKAREHALKSINISPDTSLRAGGHAVNYLMLGYAEYVNKTYTIALAWYNQSLETYKKHGQTCELPLCYTKMARVYNSMHQPGKSEELLLQSVLISDSCGIDNYTLLAKRTLFEIYKENKNHEKALNQLEEINALVGKLNNAERDRLMADMRVQYKTLLTRKENDVLRKTIEAQKRQLFLIIMASVVLCILAFFLIRLTRKHQKAKNELQNLNTGLEEKVRQRTEELDRDLMVRKKLEEQLNEKINEMETLISKLSHDMRSPLTTILGLINVASIDTAASKEVYLEKIKEAVSRLDSILVDLTSISYVTTMKEKIDIIQFEKLLNDTKTNLAYTDNIEHIRFNITIHQTKDFYADTRFISSILQNLLENAVKYSNRRESVVNVKITEHGAGIRIEVSDNGIGIDPEFREKIFNMFFRATNVSKGSGLGLYIVKRAVEKLKGSIEVRSETGVGTTFTVYLPDLKTFYATKTVGETANTYI
ncbi:MAG TPA: tetratricopeptide repeat-containing sensor histidine kinase [Flavobacteriales bacterium]|nr:tetratricopeptide repeat-containing sensor histidine kinase [Flavobacteriales bacterium]